MTTRRDFLRSFAALASGLVLAPALAMAKVQRLGTATEWIESDADRLERLMRAGPVVGQSFILDRPARIPREGAALYGCTLDYRDTCLTSTGVAGNAALVITGCTLRRAIVPNYLGDPYAQAYREAALVLAGRP